MKSLDELISCFNDIQDLSVSEEMLGAYMEGKLDGSEFRDINNIVNANKSFSEFIGEIDEIMPIGNLTFCPSADTIMIPDIINELLDSVLQEQDFMHTASWSPCIGSQDDIFVWEAEADEHLHPKENDNDIVNGIAEDTNNNEVFNINS